MLRRVALPHSLGLRYEELTMHAGFMRSSDEYKVMALASYGKPRWLRELRAAMHHDGDGGFVALPVDFAQFVAAARGRRAVLRRRTPISRRACRTRCKRRCSSSRAGCTRAPG